MSRLTLLAAAVLAVPAFAQSDLQMEHTTEAEHTCILTAGTQEQRAGGRPTFDDLDAASAEWRATARPSQTVVSRGTATTFIVTYTGFDAFPDAQAAYQSAIDIWADHLASAAPIRVTASFEPLGPTVLGSAGPFLIRNFAGAPETNVWYPYAMADAIAGVDLVAGAADITSRFSSNFTNWYFGTDGNAPSTKYDFRSVVLHELGHGLGFSGSGRWDDGASAGRCDGTTGNGCWGRLGGTQLSAQIFDLFVEAGDRTPMLNTTAFPNPSAALGALVLSQAVWAYGERIDALPFTQRGQLYTPTAWEQGSSFSHWDEARYYAGNANALMTPQIGQGEDYDTPGPLTCAFFGDMGWPLGPGCAAFVADEQGPLASADALRIVGANPFAGQSQVRLTLDAPQDVDAGLYDVTGRRVRTLHTGVAPAGPLTLTVRGEGLAAGVYAVRVTTDGTTSEVRLVHAR